MKFGLFSRVDLAEASKKRARTSQASVDARIAREMPDAAVNLLLRNQVKPYIQPGASFLVLGQTAGLDEERPLDGKIEQICYELGMHSIPYALDAVIRSAFPQDIALNVLAAAMERNVKDTIRKIRPRVVLALSVEAARIIIPSLEGSLIDVRGQAYPAHLGDHDFWLVVTHDPRGAQEDKHGRLPPWALAVTHDTKLAIRKWKENEAPDTQFSRAKPEDLRAKIAWDWDDRVQALLYFAEHAGPVVCLDYETRPLLPWKSKHSKITAIGLSDGRLSISIPFDHKLFVGASDRDQVIEAFARVLAGRVVVAHNVLFELYWTFWIFGVDAVFSAKRWECTQVGAFVSFVRAAGRSSKADGEPGAAGTSLAAQCLLYFGLHVKELSPEDAWDEDKVSLSEHLIYNGLDAYFGFLLWKKQQEVLAEKDLYEVYRFRIRRSIWLAWSSVRGMPVDHDYVAELWGEAKAMEFRAEEELRTNADVRAYEKRFGRFELTDQHVGRLLTQICGVTLAQTETGREATDKAALAAIAEAHPVARAVITLREVRKQQSTYLDKLRWDVPETYVGVDMRIHPQRSPTIAVTGRHSSKEPNAQNQPARGPWKRIRRTVKAREGWKIVSVDMGQIEARIIAMASGDVKFTESLRRGGLDVHMDWAKRLEAYDSQWQENLIAQGLLDGEVTLLRDRHKMDLKQLRGKTKNGFVFPAFFGAGAKTVSDHMLMDQDLIAEILKDFWKVFSGVKAWQKEVDSFYKKNFYVKTLTGFRIYGPLTYNNIINYGIQGTASEILQDAAERIARLARKLGRHWMVPIIDIHDDLTFHIPEKYLVEFLQMIVPIMLHPKFDFITVPLTCEVKYGDDWERMTEIGTFSSEDQEIVIHAH